jgi:hypothetical protein
LREERWLRVFENRVLRRLIGPTRDEVTGLEKAAQRGAERYVLLTQYCAGGKIETNEMDTTCGAYGGV